MYAEIKLLAARKKQTVTSIVRDAIAVYLMDKAGEIYPSGSTTPRAQITDATQEVSMVAQYDNS
jgi:hypothetical protein